MSKRDDLYAEARRLYVLQGIPRKTIAMRLGISERTLYSWATDNKDGKGTWDEQRAALLDGEKALHAEVVSLAVLVLRQIKDDFLDGKIDPKQVTNLERILKSAQRSLDYQRKAPPPKEAMSATEKRQKLYRSLRGKLGLAG